MERQPVHPVWRDRNRWRQALARSLTLRSGSMGAVDSLRGGRMALPERRDSSFDVLIYFGTVHHTGDAERGLAEIQPVPLSSGLVRVPDASGPALTRTGPLVAADAAMAWRALPHRQERWVRGCPSTALTPRLRHHVSSARKGALA
jgi:hypothetical protein